jgi:hypothetical protein
MWIYYNIHHIVGRHGAATVYGAERSWERIPVGRDTFAPVQTDRGVQQAPCRVGTGSLTGSKAAGTWR